MKNPFRKKKQRPSAAIHESTPKQPSKQPKARVSKMSLKQKLLIWFTLLGVIPAVTIASIIYITSENALEEKVQDLSEEISGQVGENLDQRLDQVYDLSMRPFTDGEVYEQMVANYDRMEQIDVFTARREVTDYFNSIRNSTDYLDEMFFYRQMDGEVIGRVRGQDMTENPFPEGVEEALEDSTFHWHSDFDEDGSLQVVLYRSVNQGILGLELSPAMFDNVLGRERNPAEEELERTLFIANNDGTIIRSNDHAIEQTMGEEAVQEDVIMSTIELENEWHAVVSTPRSVVMAEMNTIMYFVIGLVAAFIIAAVIVAFFVTNSVTRPIYRMIGLMKQAEEGDLTVRTRETGKNELGQLGSSFNHMLDNVSLIISENKSMSKIARENTEQMKRISDQSSHTAEQIASSIQEVANGAMEQVNYAEHTGREMDELSKEMKRMEEMVSRVSEVANHTKESSATSLGHMNELTAKNEDVGQNIAQIKSTIEQLSADVEGIRGVVSIIDGISDQTNLLALNASIEAARAGEAGKGFAVVADEVRKLAEQSKQSTDQIDKIVHTILGQTKESVTLVTESVKRFDEQTTAVEETKSSFDDIIADTEDTFTAVASIESSISNMNSMKEKVEKAINDMAEITETTSASTEEVSATTEEQFAAAEELGKLSDDLEETMLDLESVINRFKVEESEATAPEAIDEDEASGDDFTGSSEQTKEDADEVEPSDQDTDEDAEAYIEPTGTEGGTSR
ncbi:methyl-accepting chemotaxis protein [Salisediminibacterium beveridgei]|uniref:Methyl-accepting chemotaxis protein mcpC n=1 Tax=Salisediminibacterium beveridgei TaxID=632773 RepID=A0A1D7QRC3_9BACI|nr:methyl-accepting chemotaxis protein [Salisediminibacterium beveridgei]AOM81561.1 Methyl-accepting chemotaxis protein mcpC [Salisediminibacterium beveridgei]